MMNVAGYFFGALDFAELKKLYYFVLKLSLLIIIIISIFFIIYRNITYYRFSISGMEVALANIALYGTVILVGVTILMINSKMVDGFGKIYYSLSFTVLEMVLQVVFIIILDNYLTGGLAVLVRIALSIVVVVIVFSIFLRDIFKKLERLNLESNLEVI